MGAEPHGADRAGRMGLTIGVDIGGTKVAAGVVDDDGRILARMRRDTPSEDPEKILDVIASCMGELARDHDIVAAGLGAPGFVDAARSTVLFAPNLAWRHEPVRASIEERTGIPVVLENDANAAAWGETRFGAGNGQPFTVTLTIGTGLGGGIVLDGVLLRGAFGVAAEVGHMNVNAGGRLCGCGNQGCWEQYASGNALLREARARAAQSPEAAARLLALGDGSAEGITGPAITRAAQEGDPVALECFMTVGSWLGYGMANLAAILDPRVFILGGGVSAAGELLAAPAREAFEAQLTAHGHRPLAAVRLARLGQDAGLIGVADLARR
jgi:glucokinase